MIISYDRSKAYSEEKLRGIREDLNNISSRDCIVITFGSYARREASAQSDIDYLIIQRSDEVSEYTRRQIHEAIKKHVPIDPAIDGPFGDVVRFDELMKNLGGEHEHNHSFTRRLLLLLEGDYLKNSEGFKQLRHTLIERYIKNTPKDHQLALFLLNDIIRYWRTMTVDYMYKTTEAHAPKPWAIRNIKLIFSRKILYASGLFAIGATVDRSKEAKMQLLELLLGLPPIDRLVHICGSSACMPALMSYDHFLNEMEKETVRSHLKEIPEGDHNDRIFRDLKNEGHIFTRELLKLFDSTFHSTHPIHRAVIF